MRIAVAAQGSDVNSRVDPRFGRARSFLVIDTEDDSVEEVDNVQNLHAAQGAGIQAAENVARHKVDVVIAGNFGPKAFQALAAAGIKAASWADGTVVDAVELARNNKLTISDQANVRGHWM